MHRILYISLNIFRLIAALYISRDFLNIKLITGEYVVKVSNGYQSQEADGHLGRALKPTMTYRPFRPWLKCPTQRS